MTEYSIHADRRCMQRNIHPSDVAIVLRYGRRYHRTGIVFVFLGERDIPEGLKSSDRYARLEGLTLLVSGDGELITAYKNKDGLPKIRKKKKHRIYNNEGSYGAAA